MTVMRSAIANTSSMRWEMKIADRPSAFSAPDVSEHDLDLIAIERRGGLVENDDARRPREHLQDLDDLALVGGKLGHHDRSG